MVPTGKNRTENQIFKALSLVNVLPDKRVQNDGIVKNEPEEEQYNHTVTVTRPRLCQGVPEAV
jgi:hypothetical protein